MAEKQAPAVDEIPEFLSELINAKPEEDTIICKLAQEENVALIAFIAPYTSVRISPIEELRATIGLHEEFGVEAIVNKIKEAKVTKAYLLINSPGGAMNSSYKIAKALRDSIKEIVTFVPHMAASGGTLLALTGNKIIMGPMSNITPLDVQMQYKGGHISAATFMRFFTRSSKWFEKMTPEEAPYPRKALTDKLDPFLMEEMNGMMDMASEYATEILKLAGYKHCETIANKMVYGYPSHSYVINYDKAKDIGLSVEDVSQHGTTWKVMRYWLSKYIFEQEAIHCIRYALPNSMPGKKAKKEEKNG